MALHLDSIARLEEFKVNSIETTGEQPVVQYRGEIMPLKYIQDSNQQFENDAKIPVVVVSYKGRNVGLVVEKIIDIVEEAPRESSHQAMSDFFRSVVLQNKITDLLDVKKYLDQTMSLEEKSC